VELTGGAQVPWVEESLLSDVYLNESEPALLAEAQSAPFDEALLTTIRTFDDPTEREAAYAFYDRLGFDAEGELQATQASLTPGEQSAFVQQSLIWLSIRESTDSAIFETFLERFPDSAFVDLARLRLAALREPAPASVEVAERAQPAPSPPPVPEPPEADRAEPSSPGGTIPGAPADRDPAEPAALASPNEAEAALALDRPHLIAAQRLLAEAGHYRGDLDGVVGPMSRAAIEAFQRAEGLPLHGHLDQPTLRRLVARAASPALAGETARETRLAIHRLAAIAARGPGAVPRPIRVASIERHHDVLDQWRRVADAFEAEHAGFPVEFHYRPTLDYKQNLLLMLGSTTPPDVVFTWGGGHLAAMSEAGFARDLTAELAGGWAMRFKPTALQNLTIGDRIFAIPMRMNLVSLYANRRHLEAAGVSPAELETWTGIVNAVRKLKAAGLVPIAAGGADRSPLQLYWGAIAQALAGRETIEKALRGEGQGFADEAFVRAGELIVGLSSLEPFQPGYLDDSGSDAVDAVAAGAATMVLTGDWSIPRLQRWWKSPARIELVRIPFPPKDLAGGERLTYGGADGWVVAANAPDEAVDLVKELTSVESQSTLAGLNLAVPAVTGADSLIRDPILLAVADELTLSSFHLLFLDQALGPEAGEVLNDVALALVEGDLTPTRAAAEIDAAWKRVLGPEPAPLQREPAE
jgi:raffinose/stachyose/melibiose transport system substrate-binding protein